MSKEGEMKTCRKCGEEKPLSEFYEHPGMDDGHLNQCKDCKRAYQREYHRRKMENDPEWRERQRERSREKWRRLSDQWKSNSTPRDAHRAVANAVKRGDLELADECEDCGHDFSEFRREAHHEDYDRPLDVDWLCSLCHGKRHRGAA